MFYFPNKLQFDLNTNPSVYKQHTSAEAEANCFFLSTVLTVKTTILQIYYHIQYKFHKASIQDNNINR